MAPHQYEKRPTLSFSLIAIFALQLSAKRDFPSDVLRDSSYARQDKGQFKVSHGKRNIRAQPKRLLNFRLEAQTFFGLGFLR